MINLHYHAFFTVSLLHDYFTSKQCAGLEIVPSADCRSLFRGLDVQWRMKDNTFRAFIKVNEQQAPFIDNPLNTPPADKVYRTFYSKDIFRLYLKQTQGDFGNYTNITPLTGKKYYFSNAANNERGGTLYATQPVAGHANGVAYLPGNQVSKPGNTTNVWEAISKHTSANINELDDANLWVKLNTPAYPSGKDQVDYSAGLYTFTLPAPVSRAEIRIFGCDFNAPAPGYTVPVGEPEIQYFNAGEEQAGIPVKLTALPPGRYKITVNATAKEVYYDPALNEQGIMGVIEVFNHLPAANAYAFLDANEVVQPKQYTIHFPTRRVLWKYTRKDNKAQAINDTDAATAYAFTLHTDDFVSDRPIPLTEAAVTSLELTFTAPVQKLAPLPNPPANRLGKFNQSGYDYLCSEMYLNY